MAIKMGYNSYLGISALTGTVTAMPTLTNTNSTEFIFFNTLSLKRDQVVSQVQEIGVGGRSMKRMQYGPVTAEIGLSRHVDENNGIGLYRYLQGGSVTTVSVSASVLTHTFYEGTEVLDGGSPMRLQFEPQIGGDSATTRIWGVGLPDSYTLNAKANELITEDWTFKVQDHTAARNTVTAASYTMVLPMNATKALVSMGVTITTLSITNARDFMLNIKNNLEENRNLGTNTVSEFKYGVKEVSGSFNLAFEDYTQYQKFVDNTATAIQLQIVSSNNASYNLTFKMPECFYTGGHVSVDSQGMLVQPISFVANYSSNASYQLQISVTNSQTTAVI